MLVISELVICLIPYVFGKASRPILGLIVFLALGLSFAGTIVAIVALTGRRSPPGYRAMPVFALVLGILQILCGPVWTITACQAAGVKSSCPHVYAFDGHDYRFDADPLSGSLFAGGESDDLDRLESLAAVDGEYRLRVVNELEEVDHLDALELLVVDHAADEEVLPATDGSLVRVAHSVAPRAARDRQGRDVLDRVRAADGAGWVSRAADFAPDAGEEPRDHLTLRFDRPAGTDRALLVLDARSTRFAADAFGRYVADMGMGIGPLLRSAQGSTRYPYRDRLRDEMHRLGLVLAVEARVGDRWVAAGEVRPIGPGVLRSFAVPVTLPPGDGPVEVRLVMAPLFWEIDQARLAPAPAAPERPLVLRPTSARAGARDVTPLLATRDGSRLRLDRGESADVRFAAPPPAVAARTVVLGVRGYYEVDVPEGVPLSLTALFRHRSGRDTLPRYALRLARAR